jgi:hypothetical protein
VLNKTKYNVTIVMLLVIIGLVSALSTGFGSFNTTPVLPPDEQNQDGGGEMPTDGFTAPSRDASPLARLEFAFGALKAGAGFWAEAESVVLSMGVEQKVFNTYYRTGKEDITLEWQYSASNLAKNEFWAKYSNETEVVAKKTTSKSDFSYADKSFDGAKLNLYKTYSKNEYTSNFKALNDYPISMSKDTLNFTKHDKTSDANNYIITATVNVAKIDQEYINQFTENGTEGVNFTSMKLTFKINKKTGFLSSIMREESFKTKYSGISVNCEATMIMRFKAVNKSMKTEIDAIKAKAF